MAKKLERIFASHGFPPFYRNDSAVLVLGSFPSVKSREEAFYYAHPQNRFWRVLAACFSEEAPSDLSAKRFLLERHRIALWDSVESCEITGSSDSSIINARPTDIAGLLNNAPVERIILNGRTAERFYIKYHSGIALPAVTLPSTSPANAAWSLERLIAVWRGAFDLQEVAK